MSKFSRVEILVIQQPWQVKKYHCCNTLQALLSLFFQAKRDVPIRFHDYPPSLQIINTVHQLQRGAPQQDQLETVYLPPPRWETDQLSICQELLRSTPQETQHRLWVPEMPLIPPHTPRLRASAPHDPRGLCESWMSRYDVNDTLFFWSTGIYCHSKNKDQKQEGTIQSAFPFLLKCDACCVLTLI